MSRSNQKNLYAPPAEDGLMASWRDESLIRIF